MITLYSTFRPFTHKVYNKIQKDAIRSWLALEPQPEIIILGNDAGTEEVCKKFGLRHIKKVNSSEQNTPYMNSLISTAENAASNDIMLLLSGDIMIRQDTIEVAKTVSSQLDKFCVCARKQHVTGRFDPIKWATWQAGDYWLYSKGLFKTMPDFLIGRFLIERWMYRCCCNQDALVDATEALTVLHQHHPHNFKPNGKEIEHNQKVYEKHFFDVEKWKDTPWYGDALFHIGINFSNYVLTKDHQLITNETPERSDWQNPIKS